MRENRYRYLGLLFLLLCLVIIIFGSIDGYSALQSFPNYVLQNNNHSWDILISILPIVILIFASEGVGYFITTLFMAMWTTFTGGYKNLLQKQLNNLNRLRKFYPEETESEFENLLNNNFEATFNYHWRKAHLEILNWTTRRWNVYFGNYSIIFTIILSFLVSVIFINILEMEFLIRNILILIVFLGIAAIFLHKHAQIAKNENIQMIDLWLKNK